MYGKMTHLVGGEGQKKSNDFKISCIKCALSSLKLIKKQEKQ